MKHLLVVTALVLAGATAAAAQTLPSSADLLGMIKSRVDDGRVAGIVLGVRETDGTTRVVSYGDAGPGAQPLSANSVFEIGSISKTFTATLLADMTAKGEVKLDVPAQMYAPAGMVLPTRGGKEITLLNLSEQNSGLPRMPSNFHPADPANPYADYTVAQLDDFLAHYELPRDIGSKFEYSNLGVGTLGQILANKAGTSWEALAQVRILKPLNMTMSGVTLTPEMTKALVRGHDAKGNVVANWDLPTFAGAGALRSNMTDMLKYLDAELREPKTPLERAMHDAQTPRTDAGPNLQIGLNWLTATTKGGDHITWHNGGTGGYGTFIGFDTKRRIGVVLLTNTAGGADDIAMHLLSPETPLVPKPRPHTAIDLPAEAMAKFAGIYAMDTNPTFRITMTAEYGAMLAQATGQGRFQLFPEEPAEFFAKVVDAQITFVEAADGKPAYMILHQGGRDQRLTKLP